MTAWRRLHAWQRKGIWKDIHEVLLARLREADRLDWSRVIVDSSSVRAAVLALPPRRRLVIFLRYFADRSYREIAEIVGVSEGTVAATLSQAHRELATRLEREGVRR